MKDLGLAELFERDLNRLLLQVQSITDDQMLWDTVPGVSNSIGNLALHLVGNLSEYVGRLLGGETYFRDRPKEFAAKGLSQSDLLQSVAAVVEQTPRIIRKLSGDDLAKPYPEQVLGYPMSSAYFLMHLHGHLNYHLGQIDYLRRTLSKTGSIAYPSR